MTQTAATPPPKPNPAVLEERWLHNVMVFFQEFQRKSPVVPWLGLGVVAAIVFGLWAWVAPAAALWARVSFVVAVLLDAALLWWLPRRKISFGPIVPQLLVLLLPRLGVVAVALLVAAIWQPPAGLGAMLVLQTAGTAVYGWGMLVEAHRLGMTTIRVASPRMSAGAAPIRLLHLSDIHLERLTRREEKLLQLITEARPDIIVITGDYLNLSYNDHPAAIAEVRGLLAKIDAPFGVYATLGSPPVDLPAVASRHFDGLPGRLLRHDVVEVGAGSGRRLTLLGMDCTHDMAFDGHQFEALAGRLPPNGPVIFLYHSPELMPVVKHYNVDLYLCGHTHGGQVRVPGYGAVITSAATGKQYEAGRYDENGTTLYVSRGIGLEGLSAPRMRLFCPPEITLVEITPIAGR